MTIVLLVNGTLAAGVLFSIIALLTRSIGRDGPPNNVPGPWPARPSAGTPGLLYDRWDVIQPAAHGGALRDR